MSGSINTIENDRSPLLESFPPVESDPDRSSTPFLSPSSVLNGRDRSPQPFNRRTPEGLVRQPINYNYHSINSGTSSSNSIDNGSHAILHRYKYYNKLAPHSQSSFTMPDHVASVFLLSNILPSPGSQSSIITVFSLWNTMMGTSLLSMPWALNKAGFVTGIVLLVLMAAFMCYTSYLVLYSVRGFRHTGEVIEFSDVCRAYIGRWSEILALGASVVVLLGGMIVYWILMSNFLYNVVAFIYHHAHGEVAGANSTEPICPSQTPPPPTNHSTPNSSLTTPVHFHDATFAKFWDEQKTVPLFLILLIFPLINFRSPTFFTKFNALGTVSVSYLVCFALRNAISWGVNMEFHNTSSPVYVHEFKETFPALTGIAALAYFLQNSVLSITRTQKHPENNVRDLLIAYILVATTYIYMGIMVYMAFSLDKNCIEDNFLNNLKDTNVMAFVARIGLFFQMMCVFPLLVYIMRVQVMNAVFGKIWPSLLHIMVFNLVLVAISVLFAMFLPHIGKIIGFVGAVGGFIYAILLPCVVYLRLRQEAGTLTALTIIAHVFLIIVGVANFVAQFLLL